jgi:hypothetical protein
MPANNRRFLWSNNYAEMPIQQMLEDHNSGGLPGGGDARIQKMIRTLF